MNYSLLSSAADLKPILNVYFRQEASHQIMPARLGSTSYFDDVQSHGLCAGLRRSFLLPGFRTVKSDGVLLGLGRC